MKILLIMSKMWSRTQAGCCWSCSLYWFYWLFAYWFNGFLIVSCWLCTRSAIFLFHVVFFVFVSWYQLYCFKKSFILFYWRWFDIEFATTGCISVLCSCLTRRSHKVDVVDSKKWRAAGLWMMIVGFISTSFCLIVGNFQPRWYVLPAMMYVFHLEELVMIILYQS